MINLAIGRENEINQAIVSLIIRSLILLGPAGVGKTALVEGIEYRIQKRDVLACLLDKKILMINTYFWYDVLWELLGMVALLFYLVGIFR